jgi:hypothetical protein
VLGSRTRGVHPRATPVVQRQLQIKVDGGLRHHGATLACGRRGDDTTQGEGSSPATSRRWRRGRGRWPPSAQLGHARLGGDPRDNGGKEWVQWCLAPAELVDLHTGRSGVSDDGRKEYGSRLAQAIFGRWSSSAYSDGPHRHEGRRRRSYRWRLVRKTERGEAADNQSTRRRKTVALTEGWVVAASDRALR